jgi:hypothetical protein
MKENNKGRNESAEFPIHPLGLPKGTVVKLIPISEIKSAIMPEKAVEFKEGILCYLDLMGFSKNKQTKI